jgi:hypothetical protein
MLTRRYSESDAVTIHTPTLRALQTRKDDVTPTMNPIQASKRSFAKFNL